jgi:hypothetical protein
MSQSPDIDILAAYVENRISAAEAADRLGPGTAIVDVILSARASFGRLPDPRGALAESEYRRALSVLGLSDTAPVGPSPSA